MDIISLFIYVVFFKINFKIFVLSVLNLHDNNSFMINSKANLVFKI